MRKVTKIKTPYSLLTMIEIDDLTKKLIEKCVQDIDNKLIVNPEIKIFGKTAYQRRSVGFFSNTIKEYPYSVQTARAEPLTDNLDKLLEFINKTYSSDFNAILVNRYINGNEYIGAHSDKEYINGNRGVVSVSYGATRKFRIRDKNTKKIVKDILLDPSYILCMSGNFQNEFTHEIPPEKKIKEPRISFTFREHK